MDDVLDKLGSFKESSWKTAYGTANMAVEIAKESSDMFLPLKAVVGALSVLIQNYYVSLPRLVILLVSDNFLLQTTVNAEQITEIEEKVQSLGEILASPVSE